VRIIAGSARGRRIEAPQDGGTRPIHDRAKEGIFNMLISLNGEFEGLEVYDIFAGSGSFGLEALSRGADHVTFIEKSPGATTVIKKNIETLGFGDRSTVLTTLAESAVRAMPRVDLVFCDPPYADDPWRKLLPEIRADVLVGHAKDEIELTEEWDELKRRRYGRAKIVIAERVK
jgi:16S rRNA (guanine966-N2)-methyltransferase